MSLLPSQREILVANIRQIETSLNVIKGILGLLPPPSITQTIVTPQRGTPLRRSQRRRRSSAVPPPLMTFTPSQKKTKKRKTAQRKRC